MKTGIHISDVQSLIEYVGREMNSRRDVLAELDSLTGDGDMGVTIALCFRTMTKTVKNLNAATYDMVLEALSEQVGENAPSTFGTLMATMFGSMGKALGSIDVIGSKEFANALWAAGEGVMQRGGAKLGDKTLLDALIPAANAAVKTSENGDTLAECSEAAAKAAREGADSTVNMLARTGRAGYMGERTVGCKDPGAEAVSMMLASFSQYMKEML